jgi:hypothetical protein
VLRRLRAFSQRKGTTTVDKNRVSKYFDHYVESFRAGCYLQDAHVAQDGALVSCTAYPDLEKATSVRVWLSGAAKFTPAMKEARNG